MAKYYDRKNLKLISKALKQRRIDVGLSRGAIDFEIEKKKFGEHIRKLREKIESTDYKNRSISQQEIADKSSLLTKKH